MRTETAQQRSELISLTLMLMLSLALIADQFGSTADAAVEQRGEPSPSQAPVADIDFSIRHKGE